VPNGPIPLAQRVPNEVGLFWQRFLNPEKRGLLVLEQLLEQRRRML
jgi:hypothetical protein